MWFITFKLKSKIKINFKKLIKFRSITGFPNAPFPKIKKLFLQKNNIKKKKSTDELIIDFACLSDTLIELKLENECLSDSSFKSLASLRNLKALSFPNTYANYEDILPEVLGSLNQLR